MSVENLGPVRTGNKVFNGGETGQGEEDYCLCNFSVNLKITPR
jgi:hypothetical protein